MEVDTRMRLVEVDLDKIDETLEALERSINTMREQVDGRLGRLYQVGVSLLVGITTACVLLAVNAFMIGGGG